MQNKKHFKIAGGVLAVICSLMLLMSSAVTGFAAESTDVQTAATEVRQTEETTAPAEEVTEPTDEAATEETTEPTEEAQRKRLRQQKKPKPRLCPTRTTASLSRRQTRRTLSYRTPPTASSFRGRLSATQSSTLSAVRRPARTTGQDSMLKRQSISITMLSRENSIIFRFRQR